MTTLGDWVRAGIVLLIMYAMLILVIVGMDTFLAMPVEAATPVGVDLSTIQISDVRGALCE